MANTETATSTKSRILKYTYRNRDGNVVEKFSDQAVSVVATILEGGSPSDRVVEIGLADVAPRDEQDNPVIPEPGILTMACIFGLKTTTGNAATSVKDGDPEKIYQALADRKETLVEGEWREGREGGPLLKYVIAAASAVIERKQGKPCSQPQLDQIRADCLAKGTSFFLGVKEVRAEYDAQAAQRAIEAAQKSRAAAQDSGDALPDALAGIIGS